MTIYGATPTGFVLKPVSVILREYTDDLLSLIDPTTDVSADQPLGQALGVGSKKLGEVWQIGQVAYGATNRGDAEGDLLDNVGTLGGTERAKQSHSAVLCTATFTAPGVYPAGSLVAYPEWPASPTAQFANAEQIVVPAIGADGVTATSPSNPWPTPAGIALGACLAVAAGVATLTGGWGFTALAVTGKTITIYNAANPTHGGTFGPVTYISPTSVSWPNPGSTTPLDSDLTWFIGPATTLFRFESLDFGPLSGEALTGANIAYGVTGSSSPYGQLNQMVPVTGWATVADAGAVAIGALTELDPPYRVRQQQDLSAPGNDTLDATAAAIALALQNAPFPPPTVSVQMYENTTMAPRVIGSVTLPPKSYMAVVFDGSTGTFFAADDVLIAQAIWNNKPGGIEPYGTGGTAAMPCVDKKGNPQVVGYTRPTATAATIGVTVYTSAAIFTDPVRNPALAAAVALAMRNAAQGAPFALYGNTVTPGLGALTTLVPGQDLISEVFRSIAQGQAGVIDAQPTTGTSLITSGGLNAKGNLTIDLAHYATIDAGVTVAVALFVA